MRSPGGRMSDRPRRHRYALIKAKARVPAPRALQSSDFARQGSRPRRHLLCLVAQKRDHGPGRYRNLENVGLNLSVSGSGAGMDSGSNEGSQARFAAFVEVLFVVPGHADRPQPTHDYCLGLLMPIERKSGARPLLHCGRPRQSAGKRVPPGRQRRLADYPSGSTSSCSTSSATCRLPKPVASYYFT